MDIIRKSFLSLTLGVLGVLGYATAAGAQTTSETVVTGGATELQSQLLAIGAVVLPLGVAIVAMKWGWRFAKGFFR